MAFHQQYTSIEQPVIGQLIRRELRQNLKLTQKKFAVHLGVSFPTINRWENGNITPYPLALEQIEMLLNQLLESADATVRERCQEMRRKYFL